MGIFLSRLENVGNSAIWGFDKQLGFRKEMLDQQRIAGTAKQAEMLAQLPLGGSGNPGGGGGNNNNQNGQIQGQLNLTKFLANIAPYMAIAGISLSVYAFIAKLDRGILFIGLVAACFFSMFMLSFLFNVSQTNNVTSGPMMMSASFMSVLVAFVVSFILYDPPAAVAANPDTQLSAAEIALLKMKARDVASK